MALVTFDLNGTLLDPGEQKGALQEGVRLAMAHTLADLFRPFPELIEAGGGSPPREMPPFPDVPDALDRLAAAGHRLAVITNSARETGEQHLEQAGLRDRFERVVGVDEVGRYKPSGAVYHHALEQLGDAEPGRTWLVAAHDWDIIGAHGAGLRTAFVARGGPHPVSVRADLTVASLAELELPEEG